MLNLIKPTSTTGQALLLLHGWGFDHHIWSDFLPRLNQHYQIYQIDLPGFGETPYMPWDQFKQQLFQQLPSQIALCGWSLGGLIATRLALEHPERCSHLINIASSPCFVALNHWPGIESSQLDLFYQQLESNPDQILEQFIALQMPKKLQSNINIPKTFNLKGLKNGLNILKNWEFRKTLHTLNMPTAYLFGRLDRIVPASTITTMQTNYPDFNYMLIQKTGHMPFLTHPDICLNFMLKLTQSS
ncbi:MAG: alpha/beta fold hydrolase [Legionella sp.]|nr:alpha/beta fold hydrolase [Legionella sp.]